MTCGMPTTSMLLATLSRPLLFGFKLKQAGQSAGDNIVDNLMLLARLVQWLRISGLSYIFRFDRVQVCHGLFMGIFAILIFLFFGSVEGFSINSQPCHYSKDKTYKPALANAIFSTIAFVLGAVTSLVSCLLPTVSWFFTFAINLFGIYYGDDWEGLFEAINGYGLDGSSMALFGRIDGIIYTKAVDVGVDLVGKVERNIREDDPRNPVLSQRRWSGAMVRGALGVAAPFVASFLFSFVVGLAGLALCGLSSAASVSVPSTCRILSTGQSLFRSFHSLIELTDLCTVLE
ncbi:hypothetical protein ABZP36_007559 [Zizania latifolia]